MRLFCAKLKQLTLKILKNENKSMEDCRRYGCAKTIQTKSDQQTNGSGVNEENTVCDEDFLNISNFLLRSINKYIFLNKLNIYGAGRVSAGSKFREPNQTRNSAGTLIFGFFGSRVSRVSVFSVSDHTVRFDYLVFLFFKHP